MTNEEQGMNSDPAAAHREGEIVLYLCLISQQTFQTAPVLLLELFTGSGRSEVEVP